MVEIYMLIRRVDMAVITDFVSGNFERKMKRFLISLFLLTLLGRVIRRKGRSLGSFTHCPSMR